MEEDKHYPGAGIDEPDDLDENLLDWSGPAIEKKPCANCGKVDMTVATLIVGDTVEQDITEGEFCYDCAKKEGYCFGCGRLSAGQTEYDFGKIEGYCGSCQEQINSTVADDYGDFDEDEWYDDDEDYEDNDEDDIEY